MHKEAKMELKIVSMESTPDGYDVFIDEGDRYTRYWFDVKDHVVNKEAKFFKKDYPAQRQSSSYEVFAAVIGKFDPYVFFLKEPIPVKSMSFEEVERAAEELTRRSKDLQADKTIERSEKA